MSNFEFYKSQILLSNQIHDIFQIIGFKFVNKTRDNLP